MRSVGKGEIFETAPRRKSGKVGTFSLERERESEKKKKEKKVERRVGSNREGKVREDETKLLVAAGLVFSR